MTPLTTFSILPWRFHNTIGQVKEIKGIQIEKEGIKLSLADGKIINVETLKKSTKKLLELMSD